MKRVAIAVLLPVLVAGCTASQRSDDLQVRVDYTEDFDFSSWRSYRFAPLPSGAGKNEPRFEGLEQEARTAIEADLAERGYRRLVDGEPDFRIALDFASRGDRATNLGPARSSEPGSPPVAIPSKTNTLTLFMLDPDTGEVRWEGRVAGFSLDAIQFRAEIEAAVWRLLAEFPPVTR